MSACHTDRSKGVRVARKLKSAADDAVDLNVVVVPVLVVKEQMQQLMPKHLLQDQLGLRLSKELAERDHQITVVSRCSVCRPIVHDDHVVPDLPVITVQITPHSAQFLWDFGVQSALFCNEWRGRYSRKDRVERLMQVVHI